MLLKYPVSSIGNHNQSWERAKINLKSVSHDCRIDLSELSGDLLEIEMDGMDYARNLKNAGGKVRVAGVPHVRHILEYCEPKQRRGLFGPAHCPRSRSVLDSLSLRFLAGG